MTCRNLKYSTAFFALLLSPLFMQAQKPWMEIVSVEDLCTSYPQVLNEMFQSLDLDLKGLEQVKSAYNQGDIVQASEQLLIYYRSSENANHLRRQLPLATDRTEPEADLTLENVFIVQNVKGKVPFGADGHRDWYYKGPNNDREWAWLSNRHSQILHVLEVYFETGNVKYAQYIDEFLRDFIIKSMPYPAVKSSTSVWRGLEVAARAKVWSRIFYALLESEFLASATRLLMLSSLPDHAHYNRNFHGGNNWLTMEISALATIATNFPEYKESLEWLDYSIVAMVESMKDQVYPDGVQTELTSHYHNVSLFNFELFKNICDTADKELPDFYNQTIEDMYGYIAHAVRPDGFRTLNNDGDRGSDREHILRAAEVFNNEEWQYIATNGTSGTKPRNGPSYFYPWAGQLISRSGYDADAQWSFFDIGPWGSGHQHNDKLHLSISAYGRDLLVDAGRFAYTGETADKFRPYARSTSGHNLILIDGKGQGAGPTHASEPIDDQHYMLAEDFDFANHSFKDFKDMEGEVEHIRSLFYVRGEFWVIIDRIITDRSRQIDALWHWHPSCEVQKEGNITKTNNERGNLMIVPVSNQTFNLKFIKGQEQPEVQGWYSSEYNIYEPNVTSQYSANINESSTFVWLLLPSEGMAPNVDAQITAVSESEIQIRVAVDQKTWNLHIPFLIGQNNRGPMLGEN